MQKNELIRLDATLSDVIDDSVFSAVLENGHRFIALAKAKGGRKFGPFRLTDRVKVVFSPFDMSVAHIEPAESLESSER
jgi:translation initiation factor IF-1